MKNKIDNRKEIEKSITLAYENEQEIKQFEQELYSLAVKHNIYLIINYDKETK